jgi:hypothetical protein
VADSGVRTVVHAFDVNAEKTIEISFGSGLDCSYVGDSCVVHKNVQALLSSEFVEDCPCPRVIGNIAPVGLCIASGRSNLIRCGLSRFLVKIENADGGALLHETLRDGAANAAGGAGNDGDFAVEAESVTMWRGGVQSDTPRFQGIKSFCANTSALVWSSPLATFMT